MCSRQVLNSEPCLLDKNRIRKCRLYMRRDRMKRRIETKLQSARSLAQHHPPLQANKRVTGAGLTCSRAVIREKKPWVCAHTDGETSIILMKSSSPIHTGQSSTILSSVCLWDGDQAYLGSDLISKSSHQTLPHWTLIFWICTHLSTAGIHILPLLKGAFL